MSKDFGNLKLNFTFKDVPIGLKNLEGLRQTKFIKQQDHDTFLNILHNSSDFDNYLEQDEKDEIDQDVIDLFGEYAILDNVFKCEEKLIMNSIYKDDIRLYLYFMFSTDALSEYNYGMNTMLRHLNSICDMDSLHSLSNKNYIRYKYLCYKMSQYLNLREFNKNITDFLKEKEFVYVRSIKFLDLAYGIDGYDLDESDFCMKICLVGSK